MSNKSTKRWNYGVAAAAALILAASTAAQDFRSFRSTSQRDGSPTLSASTPGATPETTYNDPGRAFLRWFNPLISLDVLLDNDSVLAGSPGGTSAVSSGVWTDPSALAATTLAFNFDDTNPANQPYRLARTVAQTLNTTDPRTGATAVYEWQFTGLTTGSDYQLSVNIPIGPTGVFPPTASDFPQQYYVYEVVGASGGTDLNVVDTFTYGGGIVRLGNNGEETDRTYQPTGTTLTLRLYNTTPRGDDGALLDPLANPGAEYVYADSASIVQSSTSSAGITAQPVVAELSQTAPAGATALTAGFNERVYAARNEELTVGEIQEQVTIPAVTSYLYNGDLADATEPLRLNVAWNWPAQRPEDLSAAEQNRYNTDRRDWILGGAPDKERYLNKHVKDNTDALTTTTGAAFVATPGFTPTIGPDALAAAVAPGGGSQVTFSTNVRDNQYFIDAYIPAVRPGPLANEATYLVRDGLLIIDTLTLNQAGSSGWVRIPGQPEDGYSNASGNLNVVLTNDQGATSAGTSVVADAVRFVSKSDPAVYATPVTEVLNVDDGGGAALRDTVVVAAENGVIYCIDAHGDRVNNTPPQTYWTYPSELVADPNDAATEDGGVTDLPVGFSDASGAAPSVLVENLIGNGVVYVASDNGRVIALDAQGRGDTTTQRLWSFPDDYDPSNPTGLRSAPLERRIGGMAMVDPTAPTPLLLVTTEDGYIYALDAAGDPVTRTTTVVWQYPDPGLGELPLQGLRGAPVVAFGQGFITAETPAGHEVIAMDLATGRPNWNSAATSAGTFGTLDGLAVTPIDGALITGGGAFAGLDALMVVDRAGRMANLDPVTGAQRWSSTEVPAGARHTGTFTHLTAFDNFGTLQFDVPAFMVPTESGSIVGYLIDGSVNVNGNRRIFQYDLEGLPSPISVGGWAVGDFRSWMYAGDSQGFLYAFNGNDDVTANIITPGVAPGTRQLEDNDPDADDLNNIIDPNKVVLVSPETYEQMQADLNAGTLDETGVATYIAAGTVTRRTFEFGETLYMVVYDLPDLSGSLGDYVLEVILTDDGGANRRTIQTRDVISATPSTNGKIVLAAVPMVATGRNAYTPGIANVNVRARPTSNRRAASTQEPLTPVGSNGEITLANPLAVAFNGVGIVPGAGSNSIGDTTDATVPQNTVNGSPGIDPVVGAVAGPNKESDVRPLPGGYFGPQGDSVGDDLSHGGSGLRQAIIRDRSLMRLLLGPSRGLQSVRLAVTDMAWQVQDSGGIIQPHRNTYKPLSDNTGMAYPNFEQLPAFEPNVSLDYPDIRSSELSASKSIFGRVQNPLYQGVGLNPPAIADANLATYRTAAGYDAQLTRTLADTPFDLFLSIPRYQPASGPQGAGFVDRPGYRSHNLVYVESGRSGFSENEANREFALAARIGADERVEVGTPTVDLGSLPGGGGYNGGAVLGGPGGRGPEEPYDPASVFRPWNGAFGNMFEDFTVYNEGNVNLLNVRVSKAFDRTTTGLDRIFRPLELFSPGQHEMAWLDGPLHLFSSLDPLYSETGPNRSNADPEARNIIQKPRPGDIAPTRLSTNPVRRANIFLGVPGGGTLLNAAAFPPGDPRIGVSAPIGTPVGDFIRQIYAFEDTLASNGATPETPSLGPRQPLAGFLTNDDLEAFSDPAITLKFTIRESRLTNRPTSKAAPNVDNLVAGTEDFTWANFSPTGMRDGLGNTYVAWASNRQDAGGAPGFAARPRLGADASVDGWRIYISSLQGADASVGAGDSPISDLNAWTEATAGRWFTHQLIVPNVAPVSLFTANVSSLVAGSANFGAPSFPSAGTFNPMDGPTSTRADAGTGVAYLGEARGLDAGGNERQISQIIYSSLGTDAAGNVSVGVTSAMPYEPFTRKSRPALVQAAVPTIAYTSYSSGLGQVRFSSFDGANWSALQSLGMGNGFDDVGAPSAVLRRYQNADVEGRMEVTVSAKRRGAINSELMMARVATDGGGTPLTDGQRAFGPRVDELRLDAATGVYWSPGATYRLGVSDLDVTGTTFLDLYRRVGAGLVSIVDQGSRSVDRASGLVTYNTTFGGQVSIDTNSGAIRFRGAIIPRGERLYVRYAPFWISVAQNSGTNYRGGDISFDDRYLGVRLFPADPSRNQISDLRYWRNAFNAIPAASDPVRWDRTLLTAMRTSSDGSSAARPYLKTMRFGAALPTSVALDANGDPLGFTVDWTTGIPAAQQVPAAERFYQIDPANGRIYLTAGGEDRQVRVTYTGVDAGGNLIPGPITVTLNASLITEVDEQAIRIEQAVNDGGLDMFLDPHSALFNDPSVRRPGLVWLIYSSTRSGNRDVYFQTIAPQFTALPAAP